MLSFFMPGPMEMGVIGLIGLLIFGKRLPGTAKSIGQSVVEFRKALFSIGDEVADEKQQKELLPPPPSRPK